MAKASFAGVVDTERPQNLNEPQQTTTNSVIQQAAYLASDTVFVFSDDLPLSAILEWRDAKITNSSGNVPDIVEQRTSAGAASALVGYSRHATSKRISVLASSATFSLMAPTLRNAKLDNVLFYIAGAAYDFSVGELIGNTDLGFETASALGYKIFVASNSGADAQNTASAAAEFAASSKQPVVLLYDGLRGASVSSFQLLGKVGGNIPNYIYNGPKEPESVVVALASSPVSTEALLTVKVPGTDIAEHIPATASHVFVEGDALFRDVSAAVRVHFCPKNGPVVAKYKFEPTTEVPVLIWDHDRSLAAKIAEPIVRASAYIGKHLNIAQTFDHTIDSGSIQVAVASDSEPLAGSKAKALIVNKSSILRAASLSSLVPKGTLVIGGPVDDIEKVIPAQQKREISNAGFTVYALDYDLLDSEATYGRTELFALQAAVWQLLEPEISVDDVTSRIVHSNAQDMELLGSTISKLVENLREKSLLKIDTSEWAKAEVDPTKLLKFSGFKASGFYPADPIEEPADFSVSTLNKTEIAKRFAFKESFGEKQELCPDLPVKNYIAKCKINQRVTPDDYDRHIFHLELDITGTGLTYAIGEALGIHAPNNLPDVEQFIRWYGLDPEQVIAVPSKDDPSTLETKTVHHALRDNLDLFGKVPKRFYEELCIYCEDPVQKLRLQKLCGPAGAAELKKRTEEDFENYVDVLTEFSSARPPIQKLAELIAPLKRREYSIASSQKIHPNAVHLLIVVVDWVNKDGITKYGQCSKFLADLSPGGEVTVSVKPSVMKLPKDSKSPIIMAGLGTGLAPFKAFLEEKLWQKRQGLEIGDVYLFLGSRHKRQEYLYGEFFEAYKEAGILTHIGAAFSRDQKEKIYIQHRIKQAKEHLIDAFVKKSGNFYLCGPTWPVPDVSEALYDIVATDAAADGKTLNEDEVIEELKENERYILEVY